MDVRESYPEGRPLRTTKSYVVRALNVESKPTGLDAESRLCNGFAQEPPKPTRRGSESTQNIVFRWFLSGPVTTGDKSVGRVAEASLVRQTHVDQNRPRHLRESGQPPQDRNNETKMKHFVAVGACYLDTILT